MITPLVYDVHDDNDPRHFYKVDPIAIVVNNFTYNSPISVFAEFIIKYIPMCIVNKLGIEINFKRSIELKLGFKIYREATEMQILGSRFKNHSISAMNKCIYMYLRDIKQKKVRE